MVTATENMKTEGTAGLSTRILLTLNRTASMEVGMEARLLTAR